ncbi:alginate lyase family protein [Pleomorphovibrio marinus]|uniref:alginate lyase family protein n=1 Tax=Pleomorphovibrio marinus TaxID=2164132 RepID=UPI000E0A2673|nr:alginate lyase family protein [Pleomorphovibrio marinus]
MIKIPRTAFRWSFLWGCQLIFLFSKCHAPVPMDFLLENGQVLHHIQLTYLGDIQEGNLPEMERLVNSADNMLNEGPYSVTKKSAPPPSGDIHDYTSMGPYWWPDPEKEDGLPYIRRDGEVNPESRTYTDKEELGSLMSALPVLAEAYFFTGEERYAEHCAKLVRAWFLDASTKMNPNLNFAQRIPGRTEGRGIGIIDTRKFAHLPDIVTMISPSMHWKKEDQEGLEAWLKEYLDWLVNSEHGQDEAVHGNNHTTWYFAQAIPLSIFVGNDNRADSLAEAGIPLILEEMIEEDGSQPKELARTRSWDYSAMNLAGITTFALGLEELGKPVWEYQNEKGASIRDALEFLIPYTQGQKAWEYEQINEIDFSKLKFSLHVAAIAYENPDYQDLANSLKGEDGGSVFVYRNLLNPSEVMTISNYAAHF